jgi:hemoglobin
LSVSDQDTCRHIGETAIAAFVAAFFRRVAQDEMLSKIYPPHDLAGAEQRLRDFLIYRFGGSDRYIQERGHPRLRMRHAPFVIDAAARDRWVQLMDDAIAEISIPEDVLPALRRYLHETATFMINAP